MNETTQTPNATTTAEPASLTSVAPGSVAIMGLDAETLFIDATGRAWRLEDLQDVQRRVVLDAVARSADPEVLPSNAALTAASRALSRHVHDLSVDRRVALVVVAALAIDQFESVVDEVRLEQCSQDVRRLTERNKALVEALTASTEFNCRRLAHELTGRVVFALTTKGRARTRTRRPRSITKEMST